MWRKRDFIDLLICDQSIADYISTYVTEDNIGHVASQ